MFFFKQKTAYEMRISDWSSDVCSSDLDEVARLAAIDAEIEAIAEAEGEDSDGIEPLSDERDTITEGMRAFNAEQVAVGGVALWVSHDGSLGKSFYRAKAEAKPKASSGEPQPLYSNSLFADLT